MNHLTKYLEGIAKVMVPNGSYVMLSSLDDEMVSRYLKKVAAGDQVNFKYRVVEVKKMDFEQKPLKKGQVPPKMCYYLYICKKSFKSTGDEAEDRDPDENGDLVIGGDHL